MERSDPKKERQIEVSLFYLDPSRAPTQFKVTCPKNGTMADLCQALGAMAGVPSSNLTVTDVYNHRFQKIYTPDDHLTHILDSDNIFCYETAPEEAAVVTVAVYQWERRSFGQPLLVSLPAECSQAELYRALLVRMGRYVTPPPEGEEWWRPTRPAREMEEIDEEEAPTGLFTLHLVTSYGNDMFTIKDTIKLTSKNYLTKVLRLDWDPRAKEKFFNETAAGKFTQDDSLSGKKEGGMEKVAALEREIKVTEKVMLSEENKLADIEVDMNEVRAQRETNEREYRQRKNELDEAEKEFKTRESLVKKCKGKSTTKLLAQKDQLKKVLEEAAAQAVGTSTAGAWVVRFLVDSIARKAAGLECTVCLTEASNPIYGCSEYHLLCGGCKGRVASCSHCPKCSFIVKIL